ncbi:MAG: phosphate starvation-inducible protein PhoH [Elusimicrobia bacterium]|nr:MAG: phosphate starvation-inducible protein PhoH [Elusimicrobiota bacterium]
MLTRKLKLNDDHEATLLLGEQDAKLRRLEREFGVEMFVRHDPDGKELHLTVRGAQARVEKCVRRLKERLDAVRAGHTTPEEQPVAASFPTGMAPTPDDAVFVTAYGKAVRPRGKTQQEYVDTISKGDLTFGVGPAGTGKTYLAVACALRALMARECQRVILTRPIVEAGEKLGYLPGDFTEKVNPYLRPLYDAFWSMLGPDKFRLWRSEEVVEVVPLAYMRGRTLEDAFIILDEAQNATIEQMKMFLTRMGTGSRVVVTGDVTQIDLEKPSRSGLVLIERILHGVEGAKFVHFGEADVVRHQMVRKVLRAFDAWDRSQKNV